MAILILPSRLVDFVSLYSCRPQTESQREGADHGRFDPAGRERRRKEKDKSTLGIGSSR